MTKKNTADVQSHPSAALTPEMMLRDALRDAGTYSAVVVIAMYAETDEVGVMWSTQTIERLAYMARVLDMAVTRMMGDDEE